MERKIKLRRSLAECKNGDEIERYVIANDGLSSEDIRGITKTHEYAISVWQRREGNGKK